MKVFAISDLHLSISTPKPMDIFGGVWETYLEDIEKDWNDKVSDEDIVLLAGDFSWAMYLDDAVHDINYINKLKGTKVLIRGNHDYWWQSVSNVRASLPQNAYALQNDSIRLGNYVICGTRGWTAKEGTKGYSEEDIKIYKREVIRLELALQNALSKREEGDKLICMLHYPPYNSKQEPNEMVELLEKYKVDACVYGHLHGNKVRATLEFDKNGVKYLLTSCDQLQNKLKLVF